MAGITAHLIEREIGKIGAKGIPVTRGIINGNPKNSSLIGPPHSRENGNNYSHKIRIGIPMTKGQKEKTRPLESTRKLSCVDFAGRESTDNTGRSVAVVY